jgi:hypothetical protein
LSLVAVADAMALTQQQLLNLKKEFVGRVRDADGIILHWRIQKK